tara:strand:+ start:180 stop:350 length:171 start_codon:yes stop_codon:yes gene_type:complete
MPSYANANALAVGGQTKNVKSTLPAYETLGGMRVVTAAGPSSPPSLLDTSKIITAA